MKYLCVVLTITDAEGNILQQLQTHASDRMKWRVAWDKSNRIWLDSSDIGTYFWEEQPDGEWVMRGYDPQRSNDTAPRSPFGMP